VPGEVGPAAATKPRIEAHGSLREYDAACEAVLAGGPATAVPAVAGGHLDRYLRLAGVPASLTWAAFDPASAVAVRRGDRYERFGRLLAALSRRRLHELEADAPLRPVDGAPTTFVVQPEALTVDVLADAARPLPAGILTARGDEAMAALVARTVTRPARPPGAPRWLDVDAVARPDERLYAAGRSVTDRAGPLELLTVRGHSRPCCLHLDDGLFCGRDPDLADGEPIRPALGGQPSSCMQGQGCFRLDIGRGQRQPVRDVAADVLVLDGCHTLQIAPGQMPAEISMALAAMDGTAVAVVGTPWLRLGPPIPGPLLAALVASGHGLGAALALLNDCIAADPSTIGLFGLLGDAGLVLAPEGRPLTHELARVPAAIACPPGCALVRLRLPDELRPLRGRLVPRGAAPLHAVPVGRDELLVFGDRTGGLGSELDVRLQAEDPPSLLEGRARPTLRRLRTLDVMGIGLGPRVSALDRLMRELGRAWYLPPPERDEPLVTDLVGRLESSLDELHRAVVDQCVDQHATAFDTVPDQWKGPFAFHRDGAFPCPNCGRFGERFSLAHRTVPDAQYLLLSCPRCSVIGGGHRDADYTLVARGPEHAARGETVHCEVDIASASDAVLRGVVGACALGEQHLNARFRQVHHVHVEGRGSVRLPIAGSFPPTSVADRCLVVFVACLDGAVRIAYRYLWLRADGAGA